MRILVTGGAGFIGKHLVRMLLSQAHTVTIFDNFSNSEKSSVTPLADLGAIVIEGDVTDPRQVESAMKGQQIVVHLAAKISVSESKNDPDETNRVIVDGTMNVINECKKNQVKNTIIASSAAVYGDVESSDVVLTEESKTNPISPYGKSKLLMEQKVREFALKNNMNAIILRIFNAYGAGQSDEYAGVITKFAEAILKEREIVIFGDGNQIRDFVSIDDVISAINAAILILGKPGQAYNIGYGKSTAIKDLAELMLNVSDKKIPIKFTKPIEGDIQFSRTSIERARMDLGYVPKISLEDGIKKILRIQDKPSSVFM
jgi:UDP-glucose 4-epimerase